MLRYPGDGRDANCVTESGKRLHAVYGNGVLVRNALQARVLSRSHSAHSQSSLTGSDQELLAAASHCGAKATGQIIIPNLGSLLVLAPPAKKSSIREHLASHQLLDSFTMRLVHHRKMALHLFIRPPPAIRLAHGFDNL